MRALPKSAAFYFALPGIVIAPIIITYGASGAVASVQGPYAVSASKTGTGQVTIVCDRRFRKFMGIDGSWKLAGATQAFTVNVTAASGDAVTTDTLIYETKNVATATDPATGDVLFLYLMWNETQAVL